MLGGKLPFVILRVSLWTAVLKLDLGFRTLDFGLSSHHGDHRDARGETKDEEQNRREDALSFLALKVVVVPRASPCAPWLTGLEVKYAVRLREK